MVGEAGLRHNAVFVSADMTVSHDEFNQLLKLHGQKGLPYLAIYPADRSLPPVIGYRTQSPEGIAADIEAALKDTVP